MAGPLCLCCLGGRREVVELLIRVVELLIAKGADLEAKDNNCWTPLQGLLGEVIEKSLSC